MTLLLLLLVLLGVHDAKGQEAEIAVCESQYKNGAEVTDKILRRILRAHATWAAHPEHPEGRKANLCQANLRGANLSRADLRGADLREAILRSADLRGATLDTANLIGADLREANLRGVNLRSARLAGSVLDTADLRGAVFVCGEAGGASLVTSNLYGATLNRVELQRANLNAANLRGVTLDSANLQGANLHLADIRGATLNKVRADLANFSHAQFEPKSSQGLLILGASGLSTIRFSNPEPVVNLRNAAKASSLRPEERALTSALRKYQLRKDRSRLLLEGVVFGGLVTDFGAHPWGSLQVLALLILCFGTLYTIVIAGPYGKAGLWMIWDANRIHKDEGLSDPVRISGRGLRALRIGLQFSVLSAFHLGWRNPNVANWISRLQTREYTIRATGWVRVVSGLQSIISIYLLVLWVLTYFGRPFE
ncbi:MAG: pentapeptide repeat-containing protein [Anaerolineales bacterium]